MENFSNNQWLLEFAIISFIVTTLLGEIRCLSIEGIKRLMSMFKKYDRCEAFEDMQWFLFFRGYSASKHSSWGYANAGMANFFSWHQDLNGTSNENIR